jgi:hypothetical protein
MMPMAPGSRHNRRIAELRVLAARYQKQTRSCDILSQRCPAAAVISVANAASADFGYVRRRPRLHMGARMRRSIGARKGEAPDDGRHAATVFRALFYDPGTGASAYLVSELKRRGTSVTVVRPHDATTETSLDCEMDVALLGFGAEHFGAFTLGLTLRTRCRWVEQVFWFDDRTDAAAALAVQETGISRVLSSRHLVDWLDAALPQLATMTRASRDFAHAEDALPAVPTGKRPLSLPLPETERRFREAYLRRLLSESPRYSDAARRAGVPYTTFCSMVKKLNLDTPSGYSAAPAARTGPRHGQFAATGSIVGRSCPSSAMKVTAVTPEESFFTTTEATAPGRSGS